MNNWLIKMIIVLFFFANNIYGQIQINDLDSVKNELIQEGGGTNFFDFNNIMIYGSMKNKIHENMFDVNSFRIFDLKNKEDLLPYFFCNQMPDVPEECLPFTAIIEKRDSLLIISHYVNLPIDSDLKETQINILIQEFIFKKHEILVTRKVPKLKTNLINCKKFNKDATSLIDSLSLTNSLPNKGGIDIFALKECITDILPKIIFFAIAGDSTSLNTLNKIRVSSYNDGIFADVFAKFIQVFYLQTVGIEEKINLNIPAILRLR